MWPSISTRFALRDLLSNMRAHSYRPDEKEEAAMALCQSTIVRRAVTYGSLSALSAYLVPYTCASILRRGKVAKLVKATQMPDPIAPFLRRTMYALGSIPAGTRVLTACLTGATFAYYGGLSSADHCLGAIIDLERASAAFSTDNGTGTPLPWTPASPMAAEARRLLTRYDANSSLLDRGLGRRGPHTEAPQRPFLAGDRHVDHERAKVAATRISEHARAMKAAKEQQTARSTFNDDPFGAYEQVGGEANEPDAQSDGDGAFVSRRRQKEEARRARRRDMGQQKRSTRMPEEPNAATAPEWR